MAGALVVLLVVAAVAGLARLRTDTGPASFLPAGEETMVAMERAASSFGGGPIVVLAETAEPAALLVTDELKKLIALEGRLTELPDVAVVYGPGTVLNQIAIQGQNLIATITGRGDGLAVAAEAQARARGASEEEARAAGQAARAEHDRRYAGLFVRGLPAGLPTLFNPNFVRALVFGDDGEPRPQWRFIIPTAESAAILIRPRENLDQAGTERLVTAVRAAVAEAGLPTERVTVSGAPAVAAGLGEQVRREIPLLGALAVALIALCYLLVPWRRRRRERLLPLAATLCSTGLVLAAFGWLGIPLSLGVIAFLPILVGIGSDFPAYLVHGTHRRRVLVAALASAAGFAALAASPLPFVRDLGLALAAGVVVAVGVALGLRRLVAGEPAPTEEEPEPDPADAGRMSAARRLVVLAVACAVALGGWIALPRLDVEARPDRLAAGLPAVEEAGHIEDVLGSSGEVQVILRGESVVTPEALAWLRAAQAAIVVGYGDELRPIVSLPDLLQFLGAEPSPEQIVAGVQALPGYLVGAALSLDRKAALVSLGIRLQDLGDQQRLLDAVGAALPPSPPGFTAEVVGLPVAAARGYELISADRYLTNGLGILLAGLVLVVGLRRRSDAGRAVLAAALATGWGLGGAWLLGVGLSPLTMALGSLSTATACEFTILLAGGAGSAPALRRTVAVAALAASLGYLTLAASGLLVIREFGLVLAATVALSFLAAHLVVRALSPAPHAPSRPTADRAAVGEEVTV